MHCVMFTKFSNLIQMFNNLIQVTTKKVPEVNQQFLCLLHLCGSLFTFFFVNWKFANHAIPIAKWLEHAPKKVPFL